MVLKFLSELSVLGHLRISVAASACDATRIPTGLFDSVVEVDSIAYGGKLIAMRMLVEDVCLSKGLSALDVAVVVRRLEDCISSSSASPQQSRPLPGLASFLWSCIGMLRDLEAMNDFNKQSMQKGDTSGSHSGLGLSNVCGQSVLKTSVRDALVFPRRYSAIYKAFGIQPPSGILMYGPPGTGIVRSSHMFFTKSFMHNFVFAARENADGKGNCERTPGWILLFKTERGGPRPYWRGRKDASVVHVASQS